MQRQELATLYQLFACGIQNVSFCTSIPNFQAAGIFVNLNSVFSTCLSPHNQLFLQQVEYNYNENFQIKKLHSALQLCKETDRDKIDSTPISLLYCLLPLLRAI